MNLKDINVPPGYVSNVEQQVATVDREHYSQFCQSKRFKGVIIRMSNI